MAGEVSAEVKVGRRSSIFNLYGAKIETWNNMNEALDSRADPI